MTAAEKSASPATPKVFRIYVSRGRGLHCLPEDYEDIEDAKYIFEKHHGQFRWCLIGDVEPATDRPIFLLHGVVSGSQVDWKVVD
jgi:hypothetical protein